MNIQNNSQLESEDKIIRFIIKKPENRRLLFISLMIIIVQLLFFKYWYPFASFINGDSYSYLVSAFNNLSINTYPIGYSKLLRAFSVFTHSDTALVVFQYLSIQLSGLSLMYTLFFFFSPSVITKLILITFILLNPVFLYTSNYISSDAIFLSLSLIWFNLLLWSIFRPRYKNIILLIFILFLCFTFRYNSLYYPLITILGLILISKKRQIIKSLIGLSFGLLLIGEFIMFNECKYFELTGTKQFSPFAGWQLANNAMYAYKFVEKSKVKKLPSEYHNLDQLVWDYFDSTTNNVKHPEGKWMVSTIYMWTDSAPLRKYMHLKYGSQRKDEFKQWAQIAPFYKNYGKLIIRHYPLEFTKYYLYPNLLNYYSPPVEFLGSYGTEYDNFPPIALLWFNFDSQKPETLFKDFKVNVLDLYPIFIGFTNITFILILISLKFTNILIKEDRFKNLTTLITSIYFLNLLFSVFASPIVLRFQLFPMVVVTSFIILFIEKLLFKASLSTEN